MKDRLVAVELFSAGYCNMDCAYCYIPKNNKMRAINNRIIEKMKDDTFLQELKNIYGDTLTHVSLWGTEPTINMSLFVDSMLDKLMHTFPYIENFMFSTNLLSNVDSIIKFVNKLNSYDKNLYLEVQFSIDGPKWITNQNRKTGAADIIESNYKEIVKKISEIELNNLTIGTHFKPTATISNMKDLLKSGLDEWFYYFNDLFDYFNKTVENNRRLTIQYGNAGPTLVVPGDYTKEDGKVFSRLCWELFNLSKQRKFKYFNNTLNNYTHRLGRLVRFYSEIGTKFSMFTCSAGDSQLGLNADGTFGMCHRTFYNTEREYLDSCGDLIDLDRELMMADKFVSKTDNSKNKLRLLYTFRGYHDFLRFKLNYGRALTYELISSGQVDECFLDDDLCGLLCLFINSAMSCPGDNVATTGNIYLSPLSLYRIWGNGAFKILLDDYLYWSQ